jgi:hypothetical protein
MPEQLNSAFHTIFLQLKNFRRQASTAERYGEGLQSEQLNTMGSYVYYVLKLRFYQAFPFGAGAFQDWGRAVD